MERAQRIFNSVSRYGENFICGSAPDDDHAPANVGESWVHQGRAEMESSTSPLTTLVSRFPSEAAGMFRMGLVMGIVYGVCCGALMTILFDKKWTTLPECTAPLRLLRMTRSPAWRMSLWLSVGSYIWLVVGAVWVFSEEHHACRWTSFLRNINAFNGVGSEDTVFESCDYEIGYKTIEDMNAAGAAMELESVFFNIQAIIVLNIVLSILRLLSVAILFFIYIPPDVWNEHEAYRISRRGFRSTLLNDDSNAPHPSPRQRFRRWSPSSFDRLSVGVTRRRFISNDSRRIVGNDIFYNNNDDDGDGRSSSDEEEEPRYDVVENLLRVVGNRHRNRRELNPGVGYFELLQSLPIVYFSRHVFPSTLKSPKSLDRAQTRQSNCYSGSKHSGRFLPIVSSMYLHKDRIGDTVMSTSDNSLEEEMKMASVYRNFVCGIGSKPISTAGISRDNVASRRRIEPSLKSSSVAQRQVPSINTGKVTRSYTQKRFEQELSPAPPLFLPSCPICFEEFDEGAELRQLPCRHGFHRTCIDIWLMQKKTCPLCQAHCWGRVQQTPVLFPSGTNN